MVFEQKIDIGKYVKSLSEPELRKLFRSFLAVHISRGNVQRYHGSSEHGVDTLATVDKRLALLGRDQILYVQVKKGDISLTEWEDRIAGQMSEALRSNKFPFGTNRDNVRRLLLVFNGELQPEADAAIKNWNKVESTPVEVFDIWRLVDLFDGHNLSVSNLKELIDLTIADF